MEQNNAIKKRTQRTSKKVMNNKIHVSSIQKGLESIWGNPAGLKIQEIEEGILQCFMDRKYDQERILLGNPWVF
jgi:hypothetical protein